MISPEANIPKWEARTPKSNTTITAAESPKRNYRYAAKVCGKHATTCNELTRRGKTIEVMLPSGEITQIKLVQLSRSMPRKELFAGSIDFSPAVPRTRVEGCEFRIDPRGEASLTSPDTLELKKVEVLSLSKGEGEAAGAQTTLLTRKVYKLVPKESNRTASE